MYLDFQFMLWFNRFHMGDSGTTKIVAKPKNFLKNLHLSHIRICLQVRVPLVLIYCVLCILCIVCVPYFFNFGFF
jgi:hypothetical protein